jgi:hypothetical protein
MLANLRVATIVNFYQRCDEVWRFSQAKGDLYDYGYVGEVIVMPNGTRTSTQRCARRGCKEHLSSPMNRYYLLRQIELEENISAFSKLCLLCAERKALTLSSPGRGRSEVDPSKGGRVGFNRTIRFTEHHGSETFFTVFMKTRPVCVSYALRHLRHGGARGRRVGNAERRRARLRTADRFRPRKRVFCETRQKPLSVITQALGDPERQTRSEIRAGNDLSFLGSISQRQPSIATPH